MTNVGTIKEVTEKPAYSPSVSLLFAVSPRELAAPRLTGRLDKYYNQICSTVKQLNESLRWLINKKARAKPSLYIILSRN